MQGNEICLNSWASAQVAGKVEGFDFEQKPEVTWLPFVFCELRKDCSAVTGGMKGQEYKRLLG